MMASSSVRNAAAGGSPSPVGTGNAHSRRPRRVRDRNGPNGWILHRSRRLQDLEKHVEAAVSACPVQTSAGVNRGGSCSVENIGACTRQMRDLNVEETCCNCPKAAWVWVVRSARRHVALNSVCATTMSTPPINGSHGPARNARSPGHVHSDFQISELLLISQEHAQTTASQHAPASFQGQLAGDSGPAAVTYILTRGSSFSQAYTDLKSPSRQTFPPHLSAPAAFNHVRCQCLLQYLGRRNRDTRLTRASASRLDLYSTSLEKALRRRASLGGDRDNLHQRTRRWTPHLQR